MAFATQHSEKNEVSILAHFFEGEDGKLSPELARQLLELHVSERDKARMHDLAVRNHDDGLTPEEKEEMFAYGKATTLLSILKSRARRTLGVKLDTRTVS